MKMRKLLLATSLAALIIAGCSKSKDQHNASPPADTIADAAQMASPWPDYMNSFLDAYLPLNPGFAVYQGRHEFDGQLPDWSDAGIAANIAMRKKAIADARAVDATHMTDAEKFERDYLISVMDGEIFWLEEADWPHKNPAFYVGGLDPSTYVTRPYADKTTRMKAFIK